MRLWNWLVRHWRFAWCQHEWTHFANGSSFCERCHHTVKTEDIPWL
jgi:hypothetical protein